MTVWVNIDRPTKLFAIHSVNNSRNPKYKGINEMKRDGGWFEFDTYEQVLEYYDNHYLNYNFENKSIKVLNEREYKEKTKDYSDCSHIGTYPASEGKNDEEKSYFIIVTYHNSSVAHFEIPEYLWTYWKRKESEGATLDEMNKEVANLGIYFG